MGLQGGRVYANDLWSTKHIELTKKGLAMSLGASHLGRSFRLCCRISNMVNLQVNSVR
jgi:hypothetical protein